MSNVKFSELIGAEKTIHEYAIGERIILYTSPSLVAKIALRKVRDEEEMSIASVYELARNVLKAQRYKDGEATIEGWIDSVPLGEFMHFQQFMLNPTAAGDKPDSASPLTLEGFRGYDVVLPPITLGDFKGFADYLNENIHTNDEFLLEQIDKAFSQATLTDGSPLPESLLDGLTDADASALVNFWINRQRQEVKKAEPTQPPGKPKKTSTGRKSRASSAKRSDSASSPDTPTTSDT